MAGVGRRAAQSAAGWGKTRAATPPTAASNPTDRGKSGGKRSLLTAAQGVPIGLVLDGANRHDATLLDATLAAPPLAVAAARQAWDEAGGEQHRCLDAGYDSAQVRQVTAALGYTVHLRPRGEESRAKQAGQQARRWVVERTHSWLNRFRHRLIRWAKKPANYLAMLPFAGACITWYGCLLG